jgi:two-component system CheB/CheR fusion protein
MPYRTFDDRIDGLVLTFFNLSEFKQLEEKLQESEHIHQLLLNLTSHVIVKISAGFEVLEFNYEAEKYFGKKREEALGKNFVQLFIAEPMQKKTERDLKKLMNDSEDTTINLNLPAEGSHASVVKWSVFALRNTLKTPTGMILSTKKTTS